MLSSSLMAPEEDLNAEVARLRAENEALKKPTGPPPEIAAKVQQPDSSLQLRASIKTIKLGYLFSFLLAVGITAYLVSMPNQEDRMWAFLGLPALCAVFVLIRHIRRRLITLTILPDRLRYEAGLFSKTTRTLELAKVQDVRVDQTFSQRVMNIGDLSLETAGGASRIVMLAVDRPQEAADHILERARALH